MKFIERFSKINPEKTVVGNVGVESTCDYTSYFEKNFSPILFEGTFLEKISAKEAGRIPKNILSKICDLTCFMLELQKRK